MMENTTTLIGNVTSDPEMKFLNSGTAALKFSLAVNKRWQNKQTQEWEEKASFFNVVQYGKPAENAAQTLKKGYRVIVVGTLEQRSWETDDGQKRSVIEVNADHVGISLTFVTAEIHKAATTTQPQFDSDDAF